MTDLRDEMENRAAFAFLITLKRRAGQARETFDAYWADVHAPIMARMPGIWSYTLHHVESAQPTYWALPAEIERVPPADFAIEGIAELTYLSDEDAALAYGLSDAPGGYTHEDAQNVFWVGLFYQSRGTSETLKHDPAVDPEAGSVILGFQFQDDADRDRSLEWLRNFAARAAASKHTSRVRVHHFAAYDNDSIDEGFPPNMRHTVLDGEALDGAVELSATDVTTLARAFTDLSLSDDDAQILRAAHAYRVRAHDDMVLGGQITDAGIRTPHVMRMIRELGAISQEHPGLSDLMLHGYQGTGSRPDAG
jgi:hypothetical protein